MVLLIRNLVTNFKECLEIEVTFLSYMEATIRWFFLKINVDGSFCKQSGNGGWGAIARDYNGHCRMMIVGKFAEPSGPLHAGHGPITNGLKIADELGMGKMSWR